MQENNITLDTITEHSDDVHNDRSNKIQVTKICRIMKRTVRHIKPTLILAEQYLRDQMSKNTDQFQHGDDIYSSCEQDVSPNHRH